MLFTYTPDEQTMENTCSIRKRFEPLARTSRSMYLHQVGNIVDFSFTTSWCRELTVNNLCSWVRDLPSGKLDIYGIRKHGNAWGSQPHKIPGCIDKPNVKINILFHNLFQFMTEMISYVFETNTTELHSTEFWSCNLVSNMLSTVNQKHSLSCLLNNDPASTPTTPLWTTDDMYGTMFNIPSEWVKSPAVMSYLLYLPRIWGAFYERDSTLTKLVYLGKLRCNTTKVASLCGYSEEDICQGVDSSTKLWKHIARRLMIPLWFTNYGREDFWTFTYLLIKEGIAVKRGLTRVPGLLEALKSDNCSGFSSWLRKYRLRRDTTAPDWVFKLHGELHNNGPFSLLNFKSIAGYV